MCVWGSVEAISGIIREQVLCICMQNARTHLSKDYQLCLCSQGIKFCNDRMHCNSEDSNVTGTQAEQAL